MSKDETALGICEAITETLDKLILALKKKKGKDNE